MRQLALGLLLGFAIGAPAQDGERTLGGAATTIAFSRDGKWLAAGDMKGTLKIWDFAAGTEARTITAKAWIRGLSFSPDGKQLAYATSEDAVVLIDLASGQPAKTMKGSGAVAFSPDGSVLAFGDKGASGTVKLWDAGAPKERALKGHINPITSLSFAPDGKRLASGGNDNIARIWSVPDGKELHKFHGGPGLWVDGVAFSPSGDKLAYGALLTEDAKGGMFSVKGGRVVVRNAETGEEIRAYEAHTQPVAALAYSPDGKSLASCGDDKVKLWDAESGVLQRELAIGARDIAFSPDGKWLACATTSSVRLVKLDQP